MLVTLRDPACNPTRPSLQPYVSQVGAEITCFLLEASRVMAVPPGERSFHVYYQLLHVRCYLPCYYLPCYYLPCDYSVLTRLLPAAPREIHVRYTRDTREIHTRYT